MSLRYNPIEPARNAGIVSRRAPAKINWVLDLLDRRSDGFHELETVASTISLEDELIFDGNRDGEGVGFECNDGSLPRDERNLAIRAAVLLARRSGVQPDVTIRLLKRIPVGGGLGGGSSDAAATVMALNAYWKLNWPLSRLLPIAAELGSDVPMLLVGGTVIARGRGELVEPIEFSWPGWLVVAMPGLCIPTRDVYACVESSDLRGTASAGLDFGADRGSERWTAAELMARCRNSLERPAFKAFPGLREWQARLAETVGRSWRLCGSGSSFFTACDSEAEAHACIRELKERCGVRACAATIVNRTTGS